MAQEIRMSTFEFQPVTFKYQLSDLTLFSVSRWMQVRATRLFEHTSTADELGYPPVGELKELSQGFVFRSLPIAEQLNTISRTKNYIRYVPLQYQHCYINLRLTFEDYKSKFSSKTRSTINRKIRKYYEYCGGSISWKTYKSTEEMREFFWHARDVSIKTYQEKLLNVGIPDSEDFIRQAESLASKQRVRAYILFDGERPVSYLYCPVYEGVLIYAYVGYDPDYMRLSVGTVLQWLVLEQLFNEGRYQYFDFTEGQSEHKRLFATHQQFCANVFFMKKTFSNALLIYSHMLMEYFSKWLGVTMDRLGLKTKIKRFLRFDRR